ncbi:FMN-binding negative transcriptional regulator [Cellulomonas sp. zg-ZUI199]|uniref:FMN-binding negative transcriptional regulator n=1 Tax=Cellulomonas wangleii TaxID=2816956 RepID=A0ABX8D5B3_9CELL|nr:MULTISPECIES: FMN-binding negative transcriptional regulator [Cellulomonas]MBO0898351.1 FMN-binding negative transcriptional regulator [Cellulomonas sp. zg-ZUI22]MBO0924639.1 FMN-binding negative transcriptional regulator [Cellulomonas wangleii]QVI62614.1 FMN-binding negative transcriptional regulator [Cellulomonas wangleii]
MYVPVFNAVEDATEIRGLVAAAGSAELVTVGPDGYPTSTLLPVVWDGDRLVLHMARANPQWRTIGDDAPALAVVTGPQAYVSPSWYPSKAEHGRVVPTWNYSAVHLTGRARVHTDPAWLHDAVSALTDRHETGRPDRWQVTDAPEVFVEKQLRAIVGIELLVERVEAKAKLSQNRSAADHAGVVAGLATQDDAQASAVAHAMRTHTPRT